TECTNISHPQCKINNIYRINIQQRHHAHGHQDQQSSAWVNGALASEDFVDARQQIGQAGIDVVLALAAEGVAAAGGEVVGDGAIEGAIAADAPIAVVGGEQDEDEQGEDRPAQLD